jgi:mono/diheme cytochrome c family protein
MPRCDAEFGTVRVNRAFFPLPGFWGKLLLVVPLFAGLACQVERRKSDAELGLTHSQAVGRQIYDRQCGGCHEAYSSRPLKGPSLQGLYKRPYMKNGMPANDERVHQIIVQGHAKMPAFGRALNVDQIERVMEYLHTL